MKSKTRIIRRPEKALKKIEELVGSLKGPDLVKVGLPKGSNAYPDGTSVIMVGSVHEFGSPSMGIPQRSFLRTTLVENRLAYKALFKKLSKKIINGDISKEDALHFIGMSVQGDVVSRISEGIPPELTSREGTPLIDTGHLRQSITYKVEE